jgi:hypothetical protein
MKVLLGNFNAEVGRKDIFKPTTGNESLREIANDNGASAVKFAISKKSLSQKYMFPHPNIHKVTRTSPDGGRGGTTIRYIIF